MTVYSTEYKEMIVKRMFSEGGVSVSEFVKTAYPTKGDCS